MDFFELEEVPGFRLFSQQVARMEGRRKDAEKQVHRRIQSVLSDLLIRQLSSGFSWRTIPLVRCIHLFTDFRSKIDALL